MMEAEEQFTTTGSIERVPLDGDPMQNMLEGAGGKLPEGQYQIGPYTVTPSDDQSGMLEYVVRMQDALQEAVQNLHQKEVKINQLSQQVSQLTEEKNHVTSKLNAVTRTVQDKDKRMRVATNEVKDLERRYTELEGENSRKAATEAKKNLFASKKEVTALKNAQKELKAQLKAAEEAQAPLDIKCGALQEELDRAVGRYTSLEEQRVAAQEQVSALTWKLQAFEQQYAALYQQYAATIRADSPAQEGDIPRTALLADLPEPTTTILPPPPPPVQSSIDLSQTEAPQESSEKQTLLAKSSCPQCGLSPGSGKTRIGGSVHRRRQGLPIWLPEKLAVLLSLRSAPRIKVFFSVYLLLLHMYLVFFCLLGS